MIPPISFDHITVSDKEVDLELWAHPSKPRDAATREAIRNKLLQQRRRIHEQVHTQVCRALDCGDPFPAIVPPYLNSKTLREWAALSRSVAAAALDSPGAELGTSKNVIANLTVIAITVR